MEERMDTFEVEFDVDSFLANIETEVEEMFPEIGELDTPLAAIPVEEEPQLNEEDIATIERYEGGLNILAQAAHTLQAAFESPCESEIQIDCGEWLQLYQDGIIARVKHVQQYIEGSGYELDDLIQEASLAIFKGWDMYTPEMGTRTQYCWVIVKNRMLELMRHVRGQKNDHRLVDFVDAVTMAHSDLSESCEGRITWTSSHKDEDFADVLAAEEEMEKGLSVISGREHEVLMLKTMGLTQTEIGARMGISQGLVSYILSTARKQYKAAIA